MPNLGGPEVLILILVLLLLFGAKKLPELARGSGRALRIFKAETKGLVNDDDEPAKAEEQQRAIDARPAAETAHHRSESTTVSYEPRDSER